MSPYFRKSAIAHRGASSYAPEHTLEAYRLAIEQNADYVEQDLQITKDGVLICLHDVTLERTTNVAALFPNRGIDERSGRHWYAVDFMLEEIKTLDAGSWFGSMFRGAQVPTWQEAIDAIKGKAGLYPETKDLEFYSESGLNMERLLAESLERNGLHQSISSSAAPIIIQSFSTESLQRLAGEFQVRAPLVLLIEDASNLTEDRVHKTRDYALGIGPEKSIVSANPGVVKWAHAAGLSVAPYTFRSSEQTGFPTVKEEMAFFLNTLEVDAVFTDNPDLFPRE